MQLCSFVVLVLVCLCVCVCVSVFDYENQCSCDVTVFNDGGVACFKPTDGCNVLVVFIKYTLHDKTHLIIPESFSKAYCIASTPLPVMFF